MAKRAKSKERYRNVILEWSNVEGDSFSYLPIKIPVRGHEEAKADAVKAGLRFIDPRRPA